MQALLERQTKALESIQKDIKQDKIIQLAQLYEEKRLDEESSENLETLKSLDKGIKKLNDTAGDNLNGNVIKLFKEIQKVVTPKRSLNADEAKSITGAAMDRRQYNTLQPRVEKLKDNVKDFFSVRGFLDKTGIAPRNSGGLISEYLDRGEERSKYVSSRLKVDKGSTNMEAGKLAKAAGVEYSSLSDTQKEVYQKQAEYKLKQTYGKQFNDQQKIQGKITKNERALDEYKKQGFTEAQIARTPEFKERTNLATELAKVDTRVRPQGFDVKSGMVVEKPETASEQQAKASSAGKGKVIPFPSPAAEATGSLTNEESMLEQNRMVAEQSELLKKIEENTRALKGGIQGSGTTQKAAQEEEAGGLGLMDMLGSKSLGKIAKTAGRGLLGAAKTAGSFLMKRAGPLAAVTAVGMGAYEGYKGWTEASDKQEAAKEEIKAKVESGEITQGEANQLTKQVDETATVEKGGAAGKGAGMAIGGAAGALKGAAAGAAIGSVVPVVGTVVGGAIGATVGAIGGGWLGGKGGEWLGKKVGQAKNWAGNLIDSAKGVFGGNKDANQAIETEVAKRVKSEGVEPTSERANQIRQEVRAEILQKDPNALVQPVQKTAAGSNLVQPTQASKSVIGSTSLESPTNTKPSLSPASVATTGDTVSRASSETDQARLDATKGGGGNTVVSAPTINNNTQNQTSSVKLSPRNNDNTINRYMNSRYAM